MASSVKISNANGKIVTIENNDSNMSDVTLNGASITKKVDTLADMRAMNELPETVWCSGYHTKNDGAFGSHIFRLKGVKITEVDNGGTIIIATIGGVDYVYELQFDGAVNVKWFGAVGDGVTDDTSSFEATLQINKTIYIDKGTYIVNDLSDTSSNSITIIGEGREDTIIKSTTVNKFSLLIDNTFRVTNISNITFQGNNKTSHGLYINTGSDVVLDNVKFTSCDIGYLNNSTINIHISNCNFRSNLLGMMTACFVANNTLTTLGGSVLTVSTAFFPSHPTTIYTSDTHFTLNKIGFWSEQLDNPYQNESELIFNDGIAEANFISFYINGGIGNGPTHQPVFNNIWFEGTQSYADFTFMGYSFLSTDEGTNIFLNVASATLNACSIAKVWLDNAASVYLNNCGFYDSTILNKRDTASYYYANTIRADNFFSENLYLDAIIPSTTRASGGVTQNYTGFSNIGSWTTNGRGDKTAQLLYGSTSTIITGGGVLMDEDAEEITATAGNGVYISSFPSPPTVGKIYVCCFTAKWVSGGTSLRTFNLGGGSPFGSAVKYFTLTPVYKTFMIASQYSGTPSGDPSLIMGGAGVDTVFRIAGTCSLEFDNMNDALLFMKSKSLPIT